MNSRAEYGENSIPRVTICQFHEKDGDNNDAGAPGTSEAPSDPPETNLHPGKRICGSLNSQMNSKRKKTNIKEKKSFPANRSTTSSRATPINMNSQKTTSTYFFKVESSDSKQSMKVSSMSLSDGLMNAHMMDKQRFNSEGSRSVKCNKNEIVSGITISQSECYTKILAKLNINPIIQLSTDDHQIQLSTDDHQI